MPSPCAARRPRARGLTLVELLVVVGILGVLVSLAAWGLSTGAQRARVSNAAFELSSMFAAARAQAAFTGQPHYVAVYQSNQGRSGIVAFSRPEGAGAPSPDWSTLDAREVASLGTVVDSLDFSGSKGGVFGQLSHFGRKLPAPFTSVELPASASPGLEGACNFCKPVANGVVGIVRFAPNGMVSSPTATTELGGVAVALGAENDRRKLLVVSLPAGAVKAF